MFGDGVFGIEGLFWCCGAFIFLPMLYAVLLPIAVSLPGLRWAGFMLLNAAFAYAIFGFLFGDAAGFFVAAIVMLMAFFSTLGGGFRLVFRRARGPAVRRTWGRIQQSRFFHNVGDLFDGEIPNRPKRKRGHEDDVIEGDFY